MITMGAYEARTHLAKLIRAAERGEAVIITRHGKLVAQLDPIKDERARLAEVIERMKRERARRPKVSLEEILASIHEGHKY
jgi:prevent-host-death family protein